MRSSNLRVGVLLSCLALSGATVCDGINDICYIQIGGVHRVDCLPIYAGVSKNMIRAVNALNGGKGFGIKAGAAADQFFFQLNYTEDSYPEEQIEAVGAAKGQALFPKLDLVVGMGDKCSGGDPETLQFAQIANEAKRMYFTTRGPSRILTSEPFKPYFFSIHLNSDEYPTVAITQFALRGIKTAAVIWESSGNFFFEGVGLRATELVAEQGMTLQVNEQVVRVPEIDWGHLNRSVEYAIGNRSEVLICSMATPMFQHVLEVLKTKQAVHTFKALWAVNIPWGGNCGGTRELCSYGIGATQISSEEIAVYKDDLLGLTYDELKQSSYWDPLAENAQGTTYWDISSILSVYVQSVQTFYRFRAFNKSKSIFNDAGLYDELRVYMREGSLLGNTFAGPTTFTALGANGGRNPSTMQLSEVGSSAPLIFPATYAKAGFVFPAPASVACALNFFRDYSNASCPLCPHKCMGCPNGSQWVDDEICGCSPDFYSPLQIRETACDTCLEGAICTGDTSPPYPKLDHWGSMENPGEFYECRSSRCIGGPGHTCEPGFAGIMCESTAQNWSSFGAGVRMECPEGTGAQIGMHIGMIMGVLALFLIMNNILAKWFDSVDLFFDSMQRIAIVSNFRLRWHNLFYKGFPLFAILEVVLLDADLARPECLMAWNFGYSFWTQKLLLLGFLCYLWVPVAVKCFFWKRRFKLSWREVLYDREFGKATMVNEACSGTIDILTMMYPTLAKNTLDSFVCRPVSGKYYLVADPNYECGTVWHILVMATSALLQPLLVLGFPAFFVYLLWKANKDQTLHHRANLERFGVMYERYEPPFLWWENWRIIQMLLLVCIQVFLWQYPLVQANFALLLFMAGLASHYYAQPYASGVLDRMDSFAYLFSCLWTLFGINFYSSDFEWNEELYYIAMGCITVYALGTCFMAYIDVKERVDSKLAATKLFDTAKELLKETKSCGSAMKEDVARFLHKAPTEFDSVNVDAGQGEELSEMKKQARRLHRRKSEEEMVQLKEIQQTLNGAYLRHWAMHGEVNLHTYGLLRQLDEWLDNVVSDQSVTSQFSLLPEAAFYRSVEKGFPTLLGWIRNADQEEVRNMASSFTSLLKHSTLDNERDYSDVIVERDRSSVIYWLLQEATPEQRQQFFEALDMLIASSEIEDSGSQYHKPNGLARQILTLTRGDGSKRKILPDSNESTNGNNTPVVHSKTADAPEPQQPPQQEVTAAAAGMHGRMETHAEGAFGEQARAPAEIGETEVQNFNSVDSNSNVRQS